MGVSKEFIKFLKFIRYERLLCCIAGCLIMPLVSTAQNNDVAVKKNGKKYIRHIVGKGETVYGIAEKFNEQPKDIIFENPKAMDGIRPGDTLMIPVIAKTAVADTSSGNGNYIYHEVVGKETLYSLAKRYNTTIAVLDSLNPGLAAEGLKKGRQLRIPAPAVKHAPAKDTVHITQQNPGVAKHGKTEVQAYEQLVQENQAGQNNGNNTIVNQQNNPAINYKDTGKRLRRYNVALIMPFASEAGDTVRLNRLLDGTGQIPQITQISIDFYHGVIMAFDSLAKKGFKVNLHIYNISSGSDTSSYMIDSLLKKPELLQMNLIIGPPYATHFARVARFAGIHRIPVVSPLSPESNVLNNNPWTSKIKPSVLTETQAEANYIAEHYRHSNIIVIHNREAKGEYYQAFKRQFYITDSMLGNKDSLHFAESVGGVGGLAPKVSNTLVNIIVIPYEGAPFVAKFINELANSRYAKRDSVLVFGMHKWTTNDALAPDNLDTLGFHFPSNEFVNYADAPTKKFVLKYRAGYLSDPDYYAFEGYDAGMFYGNLLYTYGTDLQEHLGDATYKGLQTSFSMRRINPTTGYENWAVYIIEYNSYTEKLDSQ